MGIIASAICLTLYYFALNFAKQIYNIGFIEFDKYYLIILVVVLGIFLGFLGLYGLCMMNFLKKYPILPVSHPLTKGSVDW